jgi:hypothetical protein
VHLPVRIELNDELVAVRLYKNSTARDVVSSCVRYLHESESIDDWSVATDNVDGDCSTDAAAFVLVADFAGFVKPFDADERLYQLIRKHVLLADNTDGVRFYLRRQQPQLTPVPVRPLGR